MNKLQILSTMASLQAIAENEEAKLEDFLPLKSYAVLGDPNKFLVLGGRGSGKTRVFKTLLNEDGFAQVIGSQIQLFKPHAGNTEFIAGYNLADNKFPSQSVLSKYSDEQQIAAFWAGSVAILVAQHYISDIAVQNLIKEYFEPSFFEQIQTNRCLGRPSKWIDYIEQNPEDWENFLDEIDEYLDSKNKWLFLIYDSLDRTSTKYVDLFPYIRTLLAFWFDHLHRWKRIKCKIFLRSDLYASELLSFPDSSKLASNCLKLEWNTLSLYRLLVKRLANAGDEETILYLKKIRGLISEQPDSRLGYIPTDHEDIMEQFVIEMIGKYMGSNSKKGMSYTWAPNHLQDTHGVLSPRSFIKCYSVAAEKMFEHVEEVERLPKNRLLAPSMLQGAVQAVSEERVKELQEEYPWLEQMKKALAGATLLMEKGEFLQRIHMDLWNDKDKEGLPATSPQGIFETLQKLGIVFVAKDGRVNVPEIYLHGFGMKRKGGLRRPN